MADKKYTKCHSKPKDELNKCHQNGASGLVSCSSQSCSCGCLKIIDKNSRVKKKKVKNSFLCTSSCSPTFSNEHINIDGKVCGSWNNKESNRCSNSSEHVKEREFFYFTMDDFNALCLELDLSTNERLGCFRNHGYLASRAKDCRNADLHVYSETDSKHVKQIEAENKQIQSRELCDLFKKSRFSALNRSRALSSSNLDECVILREIKPNCGNKTVFNGSVQKSSNKNAIGSAEKTNFSNSDNNANLTTKTSSKFEIQKRSQTNFKKQSYESENECFSTFSQNNEELSIIWDSKACDSVSAKTNLQPHENALKPESATFASDAKNSIFYDFVDNCTEEKQKGTLKFIAAGKYDDVTNSVEDPVLVDDNVILKKIQKNSNHRKKFFFSDLHLRYHKDATNASFVTTDAHLCSAKDVKIAKLKKSKTKSKHQRSTSLKDKTIAELEMNQIPNSSSSVESFNLAAFINKRHRKVKRGGNLAYKRDVNSIVDGFPENILKKDSSVKSIKLQNKKLSDESVCLLTMPDIRNESFVSDNDLSPTNALTIRSKKSGDNVLSESKDDEHHCKTIPGKIGCKVSPNFLNSANIANEIEKKQQHKHLNGSVYVNDVLSDDLSHEVNYEKGGTVNDHNLSKEYLAKHHKFPKNGDHCSISKIIVAVEETHKSDQHLKLLNINSVPNEDPNKCISVQDVSVGCLAHLNKKFDPDETTFVLDDSDLVPEPLEFELPPLHRCETLTPFSEKQKTFFQSIGIGIKRGKWTKLEESILLKNYEEFNKKWGINNPCYILGIGRDRKEKKIVAFLRAKHFFARLGKNLNDRPLSAIYTKARLLLHPFRTQEKWTKSEILSLFQLHHLFGNKWGKIGRILGRTSVSCQVAYDRHEKNVRRGKWSLQEEEGLIAAIKTISGISDISPKSIENISWKEVAKLVPSRNSAQCRRRALYLSWAFRGKPNEKWNRECRKRLIYILKSKWWVEDDRMIDWEKLYESFKDDAPSYTYLQKVWHNMKYRVPGYSGKNCHDIIQFWFEKYF